MTASLLDSGDHALRQPVRPRHLWNCVALLIASGTTAVVVDVPLAQWVHARYYPALLYKLCSLNEVFGHGLGVALILLAVAVLDPARRAMISRMLAASLGAGLLANVVKLLVARLRPNHFDLHGTWADTFCGWFPLLRNPSWQQGFPSSHMAAAAGLAIVLAYYYPRGRWLFVMCAALAGCQRVLDRAHFASDVLWGAAIGCAWAAACISPGAIARNFDRLESWLSPAAHRPMIAVASPPAIGMGTAVSGPKPSPPNRHSSAA